MSRIMLPPSCRASRTATSAARSSPSKLSTRKIPPSRPSNPTTRSFRPASRTRATLTPCPGRTGKSTRPRRLSGFCRSSRPRACLRSAACSTNCSCTASRRLSSSRCVAFIPSRPVAWLTLPLTDDHTPLARPRRRGPQGRCRALERVLRSPLASGQQAHLSPRGCVSCSPLRKRCADSRHAYSVRCQDYDDPQA